MDGPGGARSKASGDVAGLLFSGVRRPVGSLGAERKEMAPQALEIAQNADRNIARVGASGNPPRQLSDVVKASACNSPPMRPFSAS